MNDKEQTGSQGDGGRLNKQLIADAARLVRIERFTLQRPAQPDGGNACDFPAPRDQRDKITRYAPDLATAAREKSFFHSVVKSNVESRKAKVGQQGKVSQGLVQAVSQCSDNEDLVVSGIDGIVQSQFEIGLILVARNLADLGTGSIQQSTVLAGQRIQVANDDGGRQSERQGMARAAVGSKEHIAGMEQPAD